MKIVLRPYQRMAVKAALKGLRGRSHRALVVLATGLGKTLTAAFITKDLRAKRILFLVHNNFILDHAISEFKLLFGDDLDFAVYNGMSKKGAEEAKCVFATWQTMSKNLKRWARNHFDLVIVDEAHHTEAKSYRPVAQYFTGAKLGITATPDREDRLNIRGIFGPEVTDVTLEEAMARGWLPRIEYHVVTDESLDEDALQEIAAEIRAGKKRFTMAEVNRRIFIRKRDVEIARIINGYSEKAVVFCASIKHAERMNRSLDLSSVFHSEAGNGQGETWKRNQAALSRLRNGTIRRICAVNAFNEGVNVPSVGLVAFCRVTESVTIFRQQLGRGLRPGKDKLIVLDFVGSLERIQLVIATMNKVADIHEGCNTKRRLEEEGYERHRFEVSGAGFEFTFSDRVVDLMNVLEHVERETYPTWQEASQAAIALGFHEIRGYKRGYRRDSRLPSNPSITYPYFPGDTIFFGRTKKSPYKSWREASKASVGLGIASRTQYEKTYNADPRLPSHPQKYYADFPDWWRFLDRDKKKFYKSWQEGSKVTAALGITSSTKYEKEYKADPRLPAHPHKFYKDFPGWPKFLGKNQGKK